MGVNKRSPADCGGATLSDAGKRSGAGLDLQGLGFGQSPKGRPATGLQVFCFAVMTLSQKSSCANLTEGA